MKKSILKAVASVLIMALLFALGLNLVLQLEVVHRKIKDTADGLFWQVEQLISASAANIEDIKKNFSNTCLNNTRIAAYAIQAKPELQFDIDTLLDLADLLQVDEIHLFSPDGEVFSGTHPEYYHYKFTSGSQMQFFLPMLTDHTLELCQDITPNTAEGKLMQYAAVWAPDKSMIVQIGVQPVRVQKAIAGQTLSNAFSVMPTQSGTALFAIDPETYRILACTENGYVGRDARACGFVLDGVTEKTTLVHSVIDGQRCCVNLRRSESAILAQISFSDLLYQEIWLDTIFLMVYILLIAIIAIIAILIYLDRKIIWEIAGINRNIQRIEQGVQTSLPPESLVPELGELCSHINTMLKAVQDSSRKISIALERSHIPIGICEYSSPHHRGFATSRMKDILMLDASTEQLSDPHFIAEAVESLKQDHPAIDENIYKLQAKEDTRYIRLEEFDYKSRHLAILVDVTRDWLEQQQMRYQRDTDELTDLYNRRGFYAQMDRLTLQPDTLGYGALALIDADGLKAANDTYGHKQGDQYLCAIAGILKSFPQEHIVAARLGGDEFVAFFHSYSTKDELEKAVQVLAGQSERLSIQVPGGILVPVQYSIGYAHYPQEDTNYHALLRMADERMYQNKRLRKGLSSSAVPTVTPAWTKE